MAPGTPPSLRRLSRAARPSVLRTGSALVAASALALVGAGCGGGNEDFRAEAEEICAEYDERIGAVVTPQSFAQLAETSREIADLLEEQLAELRELDPPSNVADEWGEWLQLTDEALENAREIQAAAEEGDEESIHELAAAAERNELEADRIARDLEIRRCMVEEREIGSDDVTEDIVTVGPDGDR